MKSYLFYDVETTGRNKCFDQVLQFAAIRTDLELNELERHEIQIKLNCDVTPDPEALLIHNIPIQTMQHGEPEIAAMCKIHKLLNTPGTISGGYNTLRFDDEFLRFSFYRNLLKPYTHQWANQCGRFDLYPITILYYLYKNDIMKWPQKDGKLSLRLEYLNQENGFTNGPAHNALVDVEATIGLAKKLFQDRKMWDYAMGYFDKVEETRRVKEFPIGLEVASEKYPLALMIGETGNKDFFQFPVISLGQHRHYKNQSLWLRLDTADLNTTTVKNITETTWVSRKKPAEPGLLLPFSERFTKHLTPERIQKTKENLNWLKQCPEIFTEIQDYYAEYIYPKVPNLDYDAALYDAGFLTPEEDRLCEQFHRSSPDKKLQVRENFHKLHLKNIVLRLMGRHFSDYLTEALREEFQLYLAYLNPEDDEKIPLDYRAQKRLTPCAALKNIEEMLATKELNEAQKDLLMGLHEYLDLKTLAAEFLCD